MTSAKFNSASPMQNITSTSTPVAPADRVHHVTLPVSRPTHATVVLNPDTAAVFRDGQLRIVWSGNEMLGAVPLSGQWELDPLQAQAKGLCKVELQPDDITEKLAAITTECDDLIAFTAENPLAKRMAERVRRMVVEAMGGEAVLLTTKSRL